MTEWWPAIGETSIVVGSGLGLVWAFFSSSRRRRKYIRAAIPPVGQARWFLLNFLSMSCFLTLVTALGLASVYGILPQTLFWFLLGLSAMAFMTALMFPSAEQQWPAIVGRQTQEPPADPPLLPLRKSA